MEPITITDDAKSAIKSRINKGPEGTIGLRLSVKPSGCSGNSYKMEYVGEADDVSGDDVFGDLFVPKMHSWMLFGMVIDYGSDDLGNEAFRFSNPNETGRCGCGESFMVGEKS